MLRIGRGIVAICLGGARSRLKCLLKTENASFINAAVLATTTQRLQHVEYNNVKQIRSELSRAKDVTSLIELGVQGSSPLKAYQAIHVLNQWIGEKKIESAHEVVNHQDFARLLKVLEKKSLPDNVITLLAGVKDLLQLGIDKDANVVQCAENSLLWNVRKVTFPVLLSIFIFYLDQGSKLQKKVQMETIDAIQRRWVEIRSSWEIQLIYNNHTLFTANFLGQLDDRTIELVEDMTISELCGIFCALGKANRRATPVLRALTFHMVKRDDLLTPRQLSNILFAMNTLSFPDPVFLERVGKDLISQISTITNPGIVGGILFCMGQMRWRQTGLLEVLSEWIENNISLCRVNDLISLIITLASVSYTPTNGESLFSKVIPLITTSTVTRESVWLDFVWSLAILDKATTSHFSSVLEASFVSKTMSIGQHLRTGFKLKLLQVNAVARYLLPSYEGPFLDLSDFKDIIVTQSRKEMMLIKHVQDMLHNFLPPPKYIKENIQIPMGIFVPIEFTVDKNAKPIPIIEYSNNFGNSKSQKELPEDSSRIAMFIWDYKDHTIGSRELTGVNQLAVKLVEKVGYKVVHIPHYEYNMRAKTIDNIKYLVRKIKSVASVSK